MFTKKTDFRAIFRLFSASVWSRPPGPPAVPGVFTSVFSDWEEVATLVGSKQTTFTIVGLQSGTQMKFRVSVQNENGFSAPTAELEHQTILGK